MTSNAKNNTDTYTVSEAVKVLKRSPIWIRRLLKSDNDKAAVLDGFKNADGRWLILKTSVESYRLLVAAKEQKRLQQLESGSTYNYVRPRAMTIQMMRRGLVENNFSKEEQEVTTRVLDKLESVWTKQYEVKRARRKK